MEKNVGGAHETSCGCVRVKRLKGVDKRKHVVFFSSETRTVQAEQKGLHLHARRKCQTEPQLERLFEEFKMEGRHSGRAVGFISREDNSRCIREAKERLSSFRHTDRQRTDGDGEGDDGKLDARRLRSRPTVGRTVAFLALPLKNPFALAPGETSSEKKKEGTQSSHGDVYVDLRAPCV